MKASDVSKKSESYPERYLDILSTPKAHFRVVRTNLVEITFVDGEQPARHCWRPEKNAIQLVKNNLSICATLCTIFTCSNKTARKLVVS